MNHFWQIVNCESSASSIQDLRVILVNWEFEGAYGQYVADVVMGRTHNALLSQKP